MLPRTHDFTVAGDLHGNEGPASRLTRRVATVCGVHKKKPADRSAGFRVRLDPAWDQ